MSIYEYFPIMDLIVRAVRDDNFKIDVHHPYIVYRDSNQIYVGGYEAGERFVDADTITEIKVNTGLIELYTDGKPLAQFNVLREWSI